MALHGKSSEQAPQQWLSRLAKERRDLSASVEATLVDESVQDSELQDELDNDIHTGRDGVVIPPRISLQSRILPVVGVGELEETMAANPPISPETAKEQRVVPEEQRTGRLTRLAQRITSSFAAFGFAMRPEALMLEPSLTDEREATGEASGTSLPDGSMAATPAIDEQAGRPETIVPTLQRAPYLPSQVPQSKQRLAGRTSKIRLETAVLHAVKPGSQKENQQEQKDQVRQIPANPDLELGQINHASASLPEGLAASMQVPQTYANDTSAHLPALDMRKKETVASALPRGSSGTGQFEVGECDVFIADKQIKEESVVLVTLIGNPGPVVVQYVSLKPQEGFTVHLTASAAAKTPFNYIVL